MNLRQDLRRAALFAACGEDRLDALIAQGAELALDAGETLYAEGETDVRFFVLLDGELQITKKVGGQESVLGSRQPGGFTGEVPLLLDTPYIATARAIRPSRVFCIGPEAFHGTLLTCSETAGEILRTMGRRVQDTEALMRQNEKLAALGKLSAGLAHELNNPAAAAGRAVQHLQETLARQAALGLALTGRGLSGGQLDALAGIHGELLARTGPAPVPDALARSDREDEMALWMDERGVDDAWSLAPTFAGAGRDVPWLETVSNAVGEEALPDALPWLETALTAAELLTEVRQSTGRISELVRAIKEYSYMDRAPVQEADIHDGLDSTLMMLGHKLKKGVHVRREYDRSLPKIPMHGSELNQVWTNLIDNAVDAMGGRGELTIRTAREGACLLVEIADDGPGIPAEAQGRIWEPFFTTKGVGKGTGLGLDMSYRIVTNRHHGTIRVESEPGNTRFQVRLPVE